MFNDMVVILLSEVSWCVVTPCQNGDFPQSQNLPDMTMGAHTPTCVIHSSQLCDVEIYLNFIYLYILYTSSAISIFNQRNASMWLFRQTKDCFLQNDFVLGHFCTACCFVEMTKVLRTLLKSVKVLRKLWKSIKVLVTLLQGLKPLYSIKTEKPWTPFTISVSR